MLLSCSYYFVQATVHPWEGDDAAPSQQPISAIDAEWRRRTTNSRKLEVCQYDVFKHYQH